MRYVYPKERETTLLTLGLLLIVAFVANGKKAKKRLPEPEDSTEDYNAEVFCKKLSRLIKMEKADEVLVVESSVNSSILLQCKYCEEKDNGLPKTWSRQKHIFTGNITEVETDMNNNVSASSVFISKSHSLVFRRLQESDVGLYFCRAPYVDTLEKSFNYLIDLSTGVRREMRGSIADFKNFTKVYLNSLNNMLANEIFMVDNLTFKMKVYTDWSDWSECDSCFRKQGVRYRLGKCRLKPICRESKECAEQRTHLQGFVFSDKQNTERPTRVDEEVTNVRRVEDNIMEYGLALSCRSRLLYKLAPLLYNITATIPDFVISEKCSGPCKGKALKKGPRYRKSIILAKGAHLTLICPDSTIDSQVRWEHNQVRIHPNEGKDYIQGTNEPRQYVDSFNTLYLFEVTDKESGNYTCFVDGVRMQEVKIIVLTRSLFFTKEFTKHLKYLGFVFLICFFAYLAGVVVMCIKTQSEKCKAVKKSQKAQEDCQRLLNMEYCDSDSY